MGNIAQFCDKNITENKIEISICRQILKSSMNKQEFNEIEETINTNEEATINILKRHKFKRFNYLKYNPQEKPTATKNDDFIEELKQSYTSAVKSQAPS